VIDVRRAVHAVLTLLSIVAVVSALTLFVLLSVGPATGGYRVATVLSSSMAPRMPVGSVILVRRQPVSELRTGQIITYRIPVDDHRVISHRVVAIERHPDYVVVQTKGDANNAVDPWTARIDDTTVWTERAVIPRLGYLLMLLTRPRVHVGLTVVAALAVAAGLLRAIWRRPVAAPPDALQGG
jgi:signal peptidase